MRPIRCIQNRAITWVVAAGISIVSPKAVGADAQTAPDHQRTFDSPAEATNALVTAAKAHDRAAVHEMFGPEVTNLFTGDKVQDEANFDSFAAAMKQDCKAVPDGPGKVVLEIGADKWPFAIPLVQTNGKWSFDTAAGEEEIINRHIGEDEFYAIGVCRSYVQAQRRYFERHGRYAKTLKGAPGNSETLGPLPPAVADAEVTGRSAEYGGHPRAFHGYVFRVLTRQGPDAPGGKTNYIHHGKMTGGFALVAFPVRWGQSGVMTFVVNQDGVTQQRSLGETTLRIASAMTEYDPDNGWIVVQDQGITKLEE